MNMLIQGKILDFVPLYSELPPHDSLLKKYGCGRAIYFSRDLETLKLFRKITHHYEIIGALVNAEYLDFKLYYQIISFPDDFYSKTKTLQEFIRGNWHGEKEPMKDFLSNFENLKYRYERQRTEGTMNENTMGQFCSMHTTSANMAEKTIVQTLRASFPPGTISEMSSVNFVHVRHFVYPEPVI